MWISHASFLLIDKPLKNWVGTKIDLREFPWRRFIFSTLGTPVSNFFFRGKPTFFSVSSYSHLYVCTWQASEFTRSIVTFIIAAATAAAVPAIAGSPLGPAGDRHAQVAWKPGLSLVRARRKTCLPLAGRNTLHSLARILIPLLYTTSCVWLEFILPKVLMLEPGCWQESSTIQALRTDVCCLALHMLAQVR